MSAMTETPSYKKARRHFLKTRQKPETDNSDLTAFRVQEKKYKSKFPPPLLDNVLDHWVLDQKLGELGGGWCNGGNQLSGETVSSIELEKVGEGSTEGKAYLISSHPGLIILPEFLSNEQQRSMIRSCLERQARAPNETNLDVHYEVPECGLWHQWAKTRHITASGSCPKVQPRATSSLGSGFRSSTPQTAPVSEQRSKRILIENPPGDQLPPNGAPLPPSAPSLSLVPLSPKQLLPKLRWANIGRSYHWGSKSYDFSKELAPFPEDVKEVCQRAVKRVPWSAVWDDGAQKQDMAVDEWGTEGPDSWKTWSETYEPDAGIVNFYQVKDTLMGHVDRSEVSSTTPLVSISLGNAAIFLIGGATRDIDPLPIILRSGDVVIMSGPRCRRAFHGVPRILEGTLPAHLKDINPEGEDDWEPFASYLQTTRINVNARQVFPRGYSHESK